MGIRPAQMILRTLFLINLVLGILFWTGALGGEWIKFHMVVGILFVITLFYVGFAAAVKGAPIGLQAGTWLVGLALAVVGFVQAAGPLPLWLRIIHLLLALLAIGLAEMAGGRARRAAVSKA